MTVMTANTTSLSTIVIIGKGSVMAYEHLQKRHLELFTVIAEISAHLKYGGTDLDYIRQRVASVMPAEIVRVVPENIMMVEGNA